MNQLRNRIGRSKPSYEDLEDELDYNFGRKEELKRDLEKLEEENDKLREAIATLRIELDDLKILKNAEILDNKTEICLLKDKLKYLKEENAESVKEFETSNENLRFQIQKIFKRDKCDTEFETKAPMISHVVLDHPNVRFKCDTCDNEFSRKIDLTMHVNKHHKHENKKNLLRKQYDELVSAIRDQK